MNPLRDDLLPCLLQEPQVTTFMLQLDLEMESGSEPYGSIVLAFAGKDVTSKVVLRFAF